MPRPSPGRAQPEAAGDAGGHPRSSFAEKALELDTQLTMSQQCALAGKKAILGCIRQSVWGRWSFPSAQHRWGPSLGSCAQVWAPQCVTHMDKVQQRAANVIKGLQHLMCEERLGDQGLYSLGRRRLKRILLMCTNTSGEGAKRTEPNSAEVSSDRARGNGHNLKHRRVPLKIRKHFFTVRVTEQWHRLWSLYP